MLDTIAHGAEHNLMVEGKGMGSNLKSDFISSTLYLTPSTLYHFDILQFYVVSSQIRNRIPLSSAKLSIGQQQPDFSTVGFGNDIWLPQRSFPFSGLLGQDMAGV